MFSYYRMCSLTQGKAHDTIHVFSLASGHLYERFLKIMMLSVVRSTKAPVKFWLLKCVIKSTQYRVRSTEYVVQST